MQEIAKIFLVMGLLFVGIAGIIYFFHFWKVSFFEYLGKLPGDIYIEKGNFRFYFPVTTSILISIVISLVLYLLSQIR